MSTVLEESQPLITEVRTKFLDYAREHPQEIGASVVKRVEENEVFVYNFLRRKHNSVEDALKMMINTGKWLTEWQYFDLTAESFPKEFYQIGVLFEYEPDKVGNNTFFMRVARHKKMKHLDRLQKQFIMYHLGQLEKRFTVDTQVAIVFDCSGIGMSNVDMDVLWFLLESMVTYCPWPIAYILVYDLPWMLQYIGTMVRNWLPAEFKDKLKFGGKQELFEYLDESKTPVYLGGTCTRSFVQVPKQLPDACDHSALDDKQKGTIAKSMRPLVEESEKELAKFKMAY